jgi:predicted nucleic acid-binding protein
MRQEVLIDTGPIVAILSAADAGHEACTEALRHLSPPLLTTWPVITEAQWLLRRNSKASEALFLCLSKRLWRIVDLDDDAIPWVAAFLKKYRDAGAQLADATLVYLAETRKISTVFTLDRRDFDVYRLSGRRRLKVIP